MAKLQRLCVSLCVLLAYAGGAHAGNFPVNISGIANTSWGIFSGGATIPTGNQTYNGIPFSIPTGASNAWVGFNGNAPATVTINPNVANATTVYALMDTVWGQPGPTSYASLTFTGSSGATFTVNLVGNQDFRDFNTPTPFTDVINNTTTINAWTGPVYDGTHFHRLDNVIVTLPAAFATQTLTGVTLTDTGNDSNFQRAILAALTVSAIGVAANSAIIPTLSVWGMLALGLLLMACSAWIIRSNHSSRHPPTRR